MDNLRESQQIKKRQQEQREWVLALLIVSVILLIVGGVFFLMRWKGFTKVASPTGTIQLSTPELVRVDLAIKIENASHDESIEFELEMDLNDAGFNVVEVEKLKETQPLTTVKYKSSKAERVQPLLEWIREDDYVVSEASSDLDPTSEYDLILTIGID